MKTQSKFYEKRTLDKFSAEEVQSVLTFLASVGQQRLLMLSRVGLIIESPILYSSHVAVQKQGWQSAFMCGPDAAADVLEWQSAVAVPTSVDCLDAAIKFLCKYGFLVDTSKTRWLVRMPFTLDDVAEACEVARLCGAPRLDHESAFDTLRRVRESGGRAQA